MEMNTMSQKVPSVPSGYWKSEMGVIPKEWKVKKFKDITDILKCGIASTPTYVEEGIPFLSSQNVKENKFILKNYKFVSEEFHKNLTKNVKPQRGDILYTRVGASFGKAAVVNFDWEFSVYVSLTLIRMKEGYNNYFYAYLLNSDKYVFNAQKTVFQGGGVQNLNVKEVEKFKMVVPPINEQIKIAEILLTWDKAIELKEKLIEQKKEQKKGLMKKLLTGEIRLPGYVEEWKTYKLSQILKIRHGKDQKKVENPNGQFPILGTGGQIGKTDQFLYDKESVLIGRKGTIDRPLYMNTPFWTVDTLFYTEIKDSFYPKYIYYIFNRIPWKTYNEASGVPSLSASTIGSIKASFPNLQEQKDIAKILTKLDQEIDLFNKEAELLKQQKKGLMQQLLTGKVRVKV